MKISRGKALRITFSIAIIPVGAVMILLSGKDPMGDLISNIGLAFIVTGVVAAFRETLILRLETEESGDDIVRKVKEQIIDIFPTKGGIQLVAPVRRGYDGYYSWAIATSPDVLFFAGRSVLHRIDADFKSRGLGSTEGVLLRRLKEGTQIHILFLDPRSNLIERLAKEEGQTPETLFADLATSIGICQRLYELLKNEKAFHPLAQLHIRIYDEVPYFAYHRENDKVIMGFYFAPALGSMSAAFEIINPNTQKVFESHFTTIFDRASDKVLLELSTQRSTPSFNEKMCGYLRKTLSEKIGEQKTDELTRRT